VRQFLGWQQRTIGSLKLEIQARATDANPDRPEAPLPPSDQILSCNSMSDRSLQDGTTFAQNGIVASKGGSRGVIFETGCEIPGCDWTIVLRLRLLGGGAPGSGGGQNGEGPGQMMDSTMGGKKRQGAGLLGENPPKRGKKWQNDLQVMRTVACQGPFSYLTRHAAACMHAYIYTYMHACMNACMHAFKRSP